MYLQEMSDDIYNKIKRSFLSHESEEEWTLRKLRKAGLPKEKALELIKQWKYQGMVGVEAGMFEESAIFNRIYNMCRL